MANPQPEAGPRAADLADRVDPNTAEWESLAALPTLGEKRAKAIVAYREKYKPRQPGDVPFHVPEDLIVVRGIGFAMVNNLSPYLCFPPHKPQTQP